LQTQLNSLHEIVFPQQVFITLLIICVTIFTVTKDDKITSDSTRSFIMLVGAFIEYLLYCWFGEEVSTSFNNLRLSLCDNLWYECTLSQQKALAIALEVSKRSVYMTGWSVVTATLRTYVLTIRESISYFLIIQTLTAGSN